MGAVKRVRAMLCVSGGSSLWVCVGCVAWLRTVCGNFVHHARTFVCASVGNAWSRSSGSGRQVGPPIPPPSRARTRMQVRRWARKIILPVTLVVQVGPGRVGPASLCFVAAYPCQQRFQYLALDQ